MSNTLVEKMARAIGDDWRIDGCFGWDRCVKRITDGKCDCTEAAQAAAEVLLREMMEPQNGYVKGVAEFAVVQHFLFAFASQHSINIKEEGE